MQLEDYKEPFLSYLKDIRGYSDLTVKTYRDAITQALENIEIQEEDGMMVANLMPYRIKIADLKKTTISKKLSAVRSFAAYVNERGIKVLLKADDSIKISKTLPKPVPNEYITQVLSVADLMQYTMILLLYTTGLRISELSGLKLENITNQWIRVQGKGSKQRDIPLLGIMYDQIGRYRDVYGPKYYLFEKNGKKLSENSLRYMISKAFHKIGLKVSPHQLRHSYATDLLNGGARISDVSELLGHSSMATTQIYTKLASSLKMQNYKSAHPLEKGEK